jgi:hypothetical protein
VVVVAAGAGSALANSSQRYEVVKPRASRYEALLAPESLGTNIPSPGTVYIAVRGP